MPSGRQQRGTQAEQQAVEFLREKNFQILGQHLTSRFGEIDILAKDGETLVAVEVKYRSSDAMGAAVESVPPSKLEKIYAALEDYCQRESIVAEKIRIDLIAIDRDHLEHLIGLS